MPQKHYECPPVLDLKDDNGSIINTEFGKKELFGNFTTHSNISEAGSWLEVHRRGEYQSFVTLAESKNWWIEVKLLNLESNIESNTGLLAEFFLYKSGIQLGVEANTLGSFFIGSYSNIFQIGQFLMNSDTRSSYLLNLALITFLHKITLTALTSSRLLQVGC